MQWSVDDTIKWLVYYIQLLKLNNQILDTFKLSGQSLCNLKIDDFQQVHAVDLYWKLQVWKKCKFSLRRCGPQPVEFYALFRLEK